VMGPKCAKICFDDYALKKQVVYSFVLIIITLIVRIGVDLRLGLFLCIPHQCHCESVVNTHGLHSFVSKESWVDQPDAML